MTFYLFCQVVLNPEVAAYLWERLTNTASVSSSRAGSKASPTDWHSPGKVRLHSLQLYLSSCYYQTNMAARTRQHKDMLLNKTLPSFHKDMQLNKRNVEWQTEIEDWVRFTHAMNSVCSQGRSKREDRVDNVQGPRGKGQDILVNSDVIFKTGVLEPFSNGSMQ